MDLMRTMKLHRIGILIIAILFFCTSHTQMVNYNENAMELQQKCNEITTLVRFIFIEITMKIQHKQWNYHINNGTTI